MGFKSSEWAYSVPNLTAPERAVLVALAHCRNDKTGACFPGQDTLVEMTALSEKTVRRALAALDSREPPLIARTARFAGRYRTSDSYELLTENHRSERPPVTVTTGQVDHRSDSPSPPVTVSATTGHSDRPIGTGRETGREQGVPTAPSPFCRKHQPNGPDGASCRSCGDARRAFDLTNPKTNSKPTAIPPHLSALGANDCPEHPGYPLTTAGCDKCKRIQLEDLGAA